MYEALSYTHTLAGESAADADTMANQAVDFERELAKLFKDAQHERTATQVCQQQGKHVSRVLARTRNMSAPPLRYFISSK